VRSRDCAPRLQAIKDWDATESSGPEESAARSASGSSVRPAMTSAPEDPHWSPPRGMNVLIPGDGREGTGGPRSPRLSPGGTAFLPLNCAAIPETLLESSSSLQKGRDRAVASAGKFENAKGTLF